MADNQTWPIRYLLLSFHTPTTHNFLLTVKALQKFTVFFLKIKYFIFFSYLSLNCTIDLIPQPGLNLPFKLPADTKLYIQGAQKYSTPTAMSHVQQETLPFLGCAIYLE